MPRQRGPTAEPDVQIEDHGTVILFRVLNEYSDVWLHENVSPDSHWFGDTLLVERRFAAQLVAAIREAGFAVGFGS